MRERDDTLWYLATGPMAAIVLGAALIPFRELTSASNWAFAFLALIVVVGHGGGRLPAIATALTSSLSLNFFLTRPYLSLTIHSGDDVVAFLGLTACGLVAATLGTRRLDRFATARQLEVLYGALRGLEHAGPPASRVQEVLEAACTAFPVTALAVRDPGDSLIACAGDRSRLASVPETATEAEAPVVPEAVPWGLGRVAPLAREGMRLPLIVGNRQVGSLDLWGNGHPAGQSTRLTLRAVARVTAAMIAAGAEPRVLDSQRRPAGWARPGEVPTR